MSCFVKILLFWFIWLTFMLSKKLYDRLGWIQSYLLFIYIHVQELMCCLKATWKEYVSASSFCLYFYNDLRPLWKVPWFLRVNNMLPQRHSVLLLWDGFSGAFSEKQQQGYHSYHLYNCNQMISLRIWQIQIKHIQLSLSGQLKCKKKKKKTTIVKLIL